MIDWETARANMVESQVRTNAVTDRRLIAAMLAVPRERFVPAPAEARAYCDAAIEIASGEEEAAPRHLMAPMPFARMVQLAAIEPGNDVLDVGCGTGYSSAVIASLAGSVLALESDQALAARAQSVLSDIGIDNVAVVQGDLAAGDASHGPYDVIMIEGRVDEVPQALFDQLCDGGRLVAAVRANGACRITRYVRTGDSVGAMAAIDAHVPPLPGFQREPGFVF